MRTNAPLVISDPFTESMHLPLGFPTRLSQGLQEASAVRVIHENGFPTVPAVQDVKNGPFILHSQLARHGPTFSNPAKHANSHLRPLYDPFTIF